MVLYKSCVLASGLVKCPVYWRRSLLAFRPIHNSSRPDQIAASYAVLQVEPDSEPEVVRDAYLRLARTYHPDSGSKLADAARFAKVEESYRSILKHQQKQKKEAEKRAVVQAKEFDICHTAPQHRHYLSNEGVGYGNPSQRQQQYEQYKAGRAMENVSDYRTRKLATQYENTVVIRNKVEAKKTMISSAIDRLVEDLILESMASGDFDDLPGKGKPIQHSVAHINPMVDTTTHNLNRILIDNGYAPEWVTLEKEIRKELQVCRQKLAEARVKVGPEPLQPKLMQTWNRNVHEFTTSLQDINEKIHKLNMIVPALWQQIMPYSEAREIKRVIEAYKEKLEAGEVLPHPTSPAHTSSDSTNDRPATLRDVFIELTALFISK